MIDYGTTYEERAQIAEGRVQRQEEEITRLLTDLQIYEMKVHALKNALEDVRIIMAGIGGNHGALGRVWRIVKKALQEADK